MMNGYNVEYIDRNYWQDSQNAYVNTAILYLVILTSGLIVDFYPRCSAPNGPVRIIRYHSQIESNILECYEPTVMS